MVSCRFRKAGVAELQDVLKALRGNGARIVDRYKPGAPFSHGDYKAFDGLDIPDALERVWNTQGGVIEGEFTYDQLWLDGTYMYLSVQEAASDYAVTLDLAAQDPAFEAYWPLGFVPIATPGDGSRLLVDCRPREMTNGQVLELFHGLGVSPLSCDLDQYFATIFAMMHEGGIYVTQDGELEYDEDQAPRIGRRLNPGMSGWAIEDE